MLLTAKSLQNRQQVTKPLKINALRPGLPGWQVCVGEIFTDYCHQTSGKSIAF